MLKTTSDGRLKPARELDTRGLVVADLAALGVHVLCGPQLCVLCS